MPVPEALYKKVRQDVERGVPYDEVVRKLSKTTDYPFIQQRVIDFIKEGHNTEEIVHMFLGSPVETPTGILGSLGRSIYRGVLQLYKALPDTLYNLEVGLVEPIKSVFPDYDPRSQSIYKTWSDNITSWQEHFKPIRDPISEGTKGKVLEMASMGLESAGTVASTLLPLGLLRHLLKIPTVTPRLAATAVGAVAGTTKTAEVLKETDDEGIYKHSPLNAVTSGILTMLIEKYTELIPLDILLKPGLKFSSRLIKGTIRDVPLEMLATAGEMIADQQILGRNFTFNDMLDALTMTAGASIFGSGALTTITHPFVRERVVSKLEERIENLVEKGEIKEEDLTKLDTPEKRQAFINKVFEGQDDVINEFDLTTPQGRQIYIDHVFGREYDTKPIADAIEQMVGIEQPTTPEITRIGPPAVSVFETKEAIESRDTTIKFVEPIERQTGYIAEAIQNNVIITDDKVKPSLSLKGESVENVITQLKGLVGYKTILNIKKSYIENSDIEQADPEYSEFITRELDTINKEINKVNDIISIYQEEIENRAIKSRDVNKAIKLIAKEMSRTQTITKQFIDEVEKIKADRAMVIKETRKQALKEAHKRVMEKRKLKVEPPKMDMESVRNEIELFLYQNFPEQSPEAITKLLDKSIKGKSVEEAVSWFEDFKKKLGETKKKLSEVERVGEVVVEEEFDDDIPVDEYIKKFTFNEMEESDIIFFGKTKSEWQKIEQNFSNVDIFNLVNRAIELSESRESGLILEGISSIIQHKDISPLVKDVKIRVAVPEKGDVVAGNYDAKSHTLTISPENSVINAVTSVIPHEVIHAVTMRSMIVNKAFRNDIETLMKDIKESSSYPKRSEFYGMTDPYNFVSELFSNRNFIKFLHTVKVPSRTFVDKIIDAFTEFVNIVKKYIVKNSVNNNAFDEAIKIVGKHLLNDAFMIPARDYNFTKENIKANKKLFDGKSFRDTLTHLPNNPIAKELISLMDKQTFRPIKGTVKVVDFLLDPVSLNTPMSSIYIYHDDVLYINGSIPTNQLLNDVLPEAMLSSIIKGHFGIYSSADMEGIHKIQIENKEYLDYTEQTPFNEVFIRVLTDKQYADWTRGVDFKESYTSRSSGLLDNLVILLTGKEPKKTDMKSLFDYIVEIGNSMLEKGYEIHRPFLDDRKVIESPDIKIDRLHIKPDNYFTPTEIESILHNKNAFEIVKSLRQVPEFDLLHKIMSHENIFPYVKSLNVKVDKDASYPHYLANEHQIVIDIENGFIDGAELFLATFPHEIIHGITVREIAINSSFRKEIMRIMREVYEQATAEEKLAITEKQPELYGMKNPFEFVCEALANKGFSVWLATKTINSAEGRIDAYSGFVNAIKDMLYEVTNGTFSKERLTALDEIIRVVDKYTTRQFISEFDTKEVDAILKETTKLLKEELPSFEKDIDQVVADIQKQKVSTALLNALNFAIPKTILFRATALRDSFELARKYTKNMENWARNEIGRFRKIIRGLSQEEIESIADWLERPTEDVPRHIKEIRKLLGDVHDFITKAGYDIGKITYYFPHIYDEWRITYEISKDDKVLTKTKSADSFQSVVKMIREAKEKGIKVIGVTPKITDEIAISLGDRKMFEAAHKAELAFKLNMEDIKFVADFGDFSKVPESIFMSNFLKRKTKDPGYRRDAVNVLEMYLYGVARKVYGDDFLAGIDGVVSNVTDPRMKQVIVEYAKDVLGKTKSSADFLVNGLVNTISQGVFGKEVSLRTTTKYTRDLALIQYIKDLGFMMSSALANSVQLALNSAVYAGSSNTLKGLDNSKKFFTEYVKEFVLAKREGRHPDYSKVPFYKELLNNGILSEAPIGLEGHRTERILGAPLLMFQGVERFNRVTSYLIGKEMANTDINKARDILRLLGVPETASVFKNNNIEDIASEFVDYTQFRAERFNAPELLKSPVARIILPYKSFLVNNLALQTYMVAGLFGKNKKLASQVLGKYVTLAVLLGGSSATPLTALIFNILDEIWKVVFGKTLKDEKVGDIELGDIFERGLPAQFGVDLSGSIAFQVSNPFKEDFYGRFTRAVINLSKGKNEDALLELIPRIYTKAEQAAEVYNYGTYRNVKGHLIVELEPSLSEAAKVLMGFAPPKAQQYYRSVKDSIELKEWAEKNVQNKINKLAELIDNGNKFESVGKFTEAERMFTAADKIIEELDKLGAEIADRVDKMPEGRAKNLEIAKLITIQNKLDKSIDRAIERYGVDIIEREMTGDKTMQLILMHLLEEEEEFEGE